MDNIEPSIRTGTAARQAGAEPTARDMIAPLIAMTVVQSMVTLSGFSVPVFAVPLARDLGIDPGAVGFYMSAVFATAMIGAILGGHGVRRFGPIRMVQLGLVAAALALLTMSTGVLILAVLASMIMGFAYGPTTPSSSHILSRTTPPKLMPLVFSIKQTGVPAGGALAGVIVPPLVLLWDWRAAAWVIAGICVLGIVSVQPLRAKMDADRQPDARFQGGFFGPIRLVLGDSTLARLSFLSFSYSAVQMSFIAYLVTYLIEEVGLDLVTAGLVLAVAQISGVTGRIVWGAVSGALVPARWLLILLGLAMTVAAMATAGFASGWPLSAIFVTAALFGGTAIGWNGVFLAEFARLAPPGQAGPATAGAVFITFGGVMVAPGLFGLILAAGLGYLGGFMMLSAMALLGAGLVWGLRERPGG